MIVSSDVVGACPASAEYNAPDLAVIAAQSFSASAEDLYRLWYDKAATFGDSGRIDDDSPPHVGSDNSNCGVRCKKVWRSQIGAKRRATITVEQSVALFQYWCD